MSDHPVYKFDGIIKYLKSFMNDIKDKDQKQLLSEAISDIQTVRNKLNEN